MRIQGKPKIPCIFYIKNGISNIPIIKEIIMFTLHSEYKPTGDQPQAIEYLSKGIEDKK